ncbi:hypothetical protein ACQPU1_11255 [Clostridium paraputrificum]|uniref:hypothetical protein n=1 Tax=Clostridium TaxID=1485 RepID=UPI003D35090E
MYNCSNSKSGGEDMQVDLYTLYLYSYSKEYLFEKNPDLKKLRSFSDSSNCLFIDDFLGGDVLAVTPMDFFSYLKKRDCFKIELFKDKDEELVIRCSCRFSEEYWTRAYYDKNNGGLVFNKKGERLWITTYRETSDKEILEIKSRLKAVKYEDK